ARLHQGARREERHRPQGRSDPRLRTRRCRLGGPVHGAEVSCRHFADPVDDRPVAAQSARDARVSWYVGIDPSSRHVGLAALHEDGTLKHQALHATGDPADRFVWLRAEIRRWLTPYADHGIWCAVIEDPAMHLAGSTLRASLGVAMEA